MKKLLCTFGPVLGFALNLCAGETLQLRLEPDRDTLYAGSPQELVLKIDLTAAVGKQKEKRTPLNVAVVLDRSGSMTGAKIEKARQAAMLVVDRLTAEDIFSVVAYDDNVEVLVPAQYVEDKDRLKSRIERVRPGGSTALYAGVSAAGTEVEKYFSAKRINRVILLSDGLANVGPSTPQQLRGLGRKLSERGISVTTIGVGDDYNEDLMAGLAEASDANYYYVQDTEKLPQIFAKELGEMLTVAAREVQIKITLPDGVKPIGFIGRPEEFQGQTAIVNLSHFTGGQNRYVFLRCKVNDKVEEAAQVQVSYKDEFDSGATRTATSTLKINYTRERKVADASVRAKVVAEKELLLTAVAKDEAIAHCDAGRWNEAAQKLTVQATLLDKQASSCPATMQSTLKKEAENLRQRSVEIQQQQYTRGSRKALQWESYSTRNAK